MDKQFFEDNNGLREDYKEILVENIRSYYFVLKIFGAWVFGISTLGLIMMSYNLLFAEEYRQGLFEWLPARILVSVLSLGFLGLLELGTYKLMTVQRKMVRKAERGQFAWRFGRVSEIRIYRTARSTHHSNGSGIYLRVDGERCTPLGISIGEAQGMNIGDELLVVNFGNITFAMRVWG